MKKNPPTTEIEVTQEHLDYLDALRESGVTNMFGAGAYLESEFKLTKSDAKKILLHWMQTFGQRKQPGDNK